MKRLDVEFLKIDGAFTQGILDDSVDRAVIHAINSIAHSVGKRTTAEYVDRPELIAALKAAGVDFLQGYYIGRPLENLQQAVAQITSVSQTKPQVSFSAFDETAIIATPQASELVDTAPIEVPKIISFPSQIELADLAELDVFSGDVFSSDIDLPAMAKQSQLHLDDRLLGNG